MQLTTAQLNVLADFYGEPFGGNGACPVLCVAAIEPCVSKGEGWGAEGRSIGAQTEGMRALCCLAVPERLPGLASCAAQPPGPATRWAMQWAQLLCSPGSLSTLLVSQPANAVLAARREAFSAFIRF